MVKRDVWIRSSEPEILTSEMKESRQEHGGKAKEKPSALTESKESGINGKRTDIAEEEMHVASAKMRTSGKSRRSSSLVPEHADRKRWDTFFEKKNSQRSDSVWEGTSKTLQRQHKWENARTVV